MEQRAGKARRQLMLTVATWLVLTGLAVPAPAADPAQIQSSGIELRSHRGAAPPAWWLVEEVESGKPVAQVRKRWGFTAVPSGDYRVTVLPQGYRALPVPWPTTVTVRGRKPTRLEITSGMELAAPSPELPPPEWWFVEDAASGKRVAQVHKRWGYTPLPAGLYALKLIPQGHGALPVNWGRTQLAEGRPVRIELSSGVRLERQFEGQPPPQWWFVEDRAAGERVAQVHERWGFAPLPPGHYAVKLPHDYGTGSADVHVVPNTTASLRPEDLGIGRLEIELPASRHVRFASGPAQVAAGIRRGDKIWAVPLPEGDATTVTSFDLDAGPLEVVYLSGPMSLAVPVTAIAGEIQRVPFDPAKLAKDHHLSVFSVEVTDATGAQAAGTGQIIITEAEQGTLLTLERAPSGTVWLAPAGASARWRVGDREQASADLPAGETARLSLPRQATRQDARPPPVEVDIVIQSPRDGAIIDAEAVTVTGRASTTAEAGVTQIALVIDSSGSTSDPSGVDLDGDGKQESILSAEVAAARLLLDELETVEANSAGTAFAITLLRFSEQAEVLAPLTLMSDAGSVQAVRRGLDRLAQIGSGGDTYYDRALDAAIDVFQAAELPGVRLILLISDGKPSDLRAGLAAAARAGMQKVIIHSFGLGKDFRGDVPAQPFFPPYPSGGVDILATVATLGRAGGEATPLPRPGDIVSVVPRLPVLELPDAELEMVRIANATTGEVATEVQLGRDGAFQGQVPVSLIPRGNHEANILLATAIARGSEVQASDRVRVRTGLTDEVRQILQVLQREKTELLARNQALEQRTAALQQAIPSLESRIKALEETKSQTDLESERLARERTTCEEQRRDLAPSLASQKTLIGELQGELASLEKQIQTTEDENRALLDQGVAARAEMTELRDHLQRLQGNGKELRATLVACGARSQALQRRLDAEEANQAQLTACTAALGSARAATADLTEALTACRSAPGSLEVVAVSRDGRVPPALLPQVELILDASNSMWGQIEGKPKIVIAQEIVEQVIGTLPDGIRVALRTYGHRRHYREARACRDSELMVPFSELQKAQMVELIRNLQPRGSTPLAYSLAQIASDFEGVPGEKIVVLVTDGKEECGGQPEDEVLHLKQSGFQLVLHVVGFALADEATKDAMRRVAHLTGGRFFDAQAPVQLRDALRQSFSVPMTVMNELDEPVARGHVDQGGLQLPPGRYEVIVQAPSAPITVRDVHVSPSRTTKVLLQSTRAGIEASVQPGGEPGPLSTDINQTGGAPVTMGAQAQSGIDEPGGAAR